MDGMNDQAGAGQEASDQSLMDTILGTSGSTDTTGTDQTTSSGQSGQSGQPYTFAGRQFKGGQTEAEKWANKIYGEFSKHQGTLKELKAAFEADPESLQEAAKDPKWAAIIGKLGIEVAREEAAEEEAAAQKGRGGEDYQSILNEVRLERAQMALDREEQQFERKLGRALSTDEHNAVMQIIQRASSLSYEEAFNLAFHKKMLDDAAKRAGQQTKPSNGRPKPPPMHVPGIKTDSGKTSVANMSPGEWRQHLKESQEMSDLMSRG